MIRAAIGSLLGRQATPQDFPPSLPLFRPTQPTLLCSVQKEPYIHSGYAMTHQFRVEHGANASQFSQAWQETYRLQGTTRTSLTRAFHKYMDDHGPIGHGRVVIQVGSLWKGSFVIEENPEGSVLVLRLVGYGPEEEVLDWSRDGFAISQQLR